MRVGESVESREREREVRLRKKARAKNATGAGKKGSSQVVCKLLAGIEDCFR